MRRILIGFCVTIVLGFRAFGQSAPATQPASTSVASEPAPVLILPFISPPEGRFRDLGHSIQQDLASEIATDLRGRVMALGAASAPADAAAALAAGKENHASAVVFGRAQVNGEQVRLTGAVLDVASGRTLGSLNQAGPVDQLFQLEDALTPQVAAALPEGLLNLRGLLSTRPKTRPQIIYLPGDVPSPNYSHPIDGGYTGPVSPYVLPPAPGSPPPYSPDAGSYPYRFVAPYAHLFSYDYDPDPFLPLYGGYGYYPDRFARHRVDRPPLEHEHEDDAPHRR